MTTNSTDLDLTEAIGAAASHLPSGYLHREELVRAIAAAAPLIEAQVRERIAAELVEHAQVYVTPWAASKREATLEAARIARGGGW